MVYITVRYGEREQEIFNPNCRTKALLSSIKRRCQCATDVEIELSDESGNVKNMRLALNRYASEILTERETLVLLRVQKNKSENDGTTLYIPLLNDNEAITKEFLAKLTIPFSPSSRPPSQQKLVQQKSEDIPTPRPVREKTREKIKSGRDRRKQKPK
ncbi:hypothetical protein ScPMuIL_007629 [Solemya velum]